jgi:hypothetical protein
MAESYEWVYVDEGSIPNPPPPPVMKPVFTHTVTQAPVSNTIRYPKVGLMDVVLFIFVMHYLKKSVNQLFPDKF